MKFLDFFSGIGGFRLGMEMAGHECLGHVEIDKFANKSYAAMHLPKESEYFATDIRTVEPGDLPDADCYCFGFPCQAFSVAGKRGGFEDTRGTLFFEVMRLAAVRKPKYLFAENVAGLLSHDGGKTFGTILNTLGQLGYWFEYQVLNSKDFRVPQNRERVFIIGHLGKYSGREVFPISGSNGETLKQIIGGSQGDRVYDPSGASCTLASQGGGGAKTGLYFIDLSTQETRITDNARCLQARYNKGYSNRKGEGSGILDVRAVIDPGRPNKTMNGRQIKEPGEEMFCLTAQDRHGVMIADNIDWDELEAQDCRETDKAIEESEKEIRSNGVNYCDLYDVAILRPTRTEYGRQIRKQYESGNIEESRHNMTKLEPRTDGISNTISTVQKDNLLMVQISEATKKGYSEAYEGDSINLAVPGSEARRGRVGVANTLDTSCNQATLQQGRIRRLTPRECFRLQGYPDKYFDRAAAVNSDSQLYKQAGNSVTVNVIYEIARRL